MKIYVKDGVLKIKWNYSELSLAFPFLFEEMDFNCNGYLWITGSSLIQL